MIDCPKCGFSQDEDRYCANCGIDMAAFKPPKAPIGQRILSSWVFHLALIVGAILTTAVILQSHRESALRARIASVARAPESRAIERKVATPPGGATAPGPGNQQAGGPTAPALAAAPAPAAPAPALPDDGIVPASATNASVVDAAAGAPVAAPTKLQIVLGDFPKTFLDDLANSAEDAKTYGPWGDAVVKISDANRVNFKSQWQSTDPLFGAPIEFAKRNRASAAGLVVRATVAPDDGSGTITLNIEIARAMSDPPGSPVQEKYFPETFALKAQQVAYMYGLLPRRKVDNAELSLYAGTPLTVLGTPGFQSGTTEFAAFFVPSP
jgi:hypothetical protein